MTLPTTRIDTLSVSVTPELNPHSELNNGDHPHQEEDILLVDFIPNGNPHINNTNPTSPTEGNLSLQQSRFPSTYSSAASSSNNATIPMYNNYPNSIRPVGDQYPHHRYNSNSQSHHHQQQDLSNFTLVNLTNQPTINHNEQGVEDEDEMEEESEQLMESHSRFHNSAPGGNNPVLPLKLKRNSFMSSGNANHSSSAALLGNNGFQKVSSSLTSSSTSNDDSDTGFLVPQNNGGGGGRGDFLGKDKHNHHHKIRRNNQIESINNTPSYPGSPGFQPSHRKRLRRRRSSGPRRKSTLHQNSGDHHHDALSACCCLGDDEQLLSPYQRSSLTSRYLRFSCFIVLIIAITTFASIVVSLQRKVDSLSAEVIKLGIDVAAGSSTLETSQSDQDIRKSLLLDLSNQEIRVNASLSAIKNLMDELSLKVSKLEKQPSIEQVRQEEARLGTDLKGYIDELKREFENFKTAHEQNHPPGESKAIPPVSVTTPSKEPT